MFRNQRHKNKCLEGHLVLLVVVFDWKWAPRWSNHLLSSLFASCSKPMSWSTQLLEFVAYFTSRSFGNHSLDTAYSYCQATPFPPKRKHERNERGQISPKRNLSQVRAIPVPGPAKKHVGSQQPKNMYGTKRGTITMRFITLQAKLTKTSQNHGCDAHKSQDIKIY